MLCSYCSKEFNNTFSIHSRSCEIYQKCIKKITKESLIDLYINKQMSCLDIQNHYGLSHPSFIYRKMKEFGIKRRNGSEYGKLSEKKRRVTLLKKTGFPHNFCKGGKIRNKVEEDLKKDGFINWFQKEEVKLKSIQTLLKKYGTECPWKTDTIRGKRSYSTLHKRVVDICHELNINIRIEFKIKKDKEPRYYAYDIILDNTNKIIEVNGDYWHGNPELYKPSDILLKGSSREITVKEKHKFDKKKNMFAISKGYSVLILWEKDIKENIDRIKQLIIDYSSTQQISPTISSSTLL